jgi:hypothetical protein
MRNNVFGTALGLLFLLPILAQSQTVLTAQQKRKYAQELLQIYNPEGIYIIKKVDSMAYGNAYDRYVDGNSEQDVREAVGTIVHELNHGYSALMAWKLRPRELDQYACYYMGEQQHVLVKYTPVFPTEEFGKTIPKQLQTLRFQTYVYNPNERIQLTSSTLGIYGLMDEWIAYYHGTVTDVNMYKWYMEHTKGSVLDWYNYFSTVGSVINAYVEFKYFCLAYLVYAQQHKPAVYKGILGNRHFVEVFLKINRLYGNLVQNYQSIKANILNNLKSQGVKVVENDEWIVMNKQGVGNFVAEYKVLENELKKPSYQSMLETLEAAAGPAQPGNQGSN